MKHPINLTEDLYIGRGMHKKVYTYPSDTSLCIKVPFTKNDVDLNRELRYRKVLSNQKKPVTIIPQYYGTVETNYGTGYVFERIRNFDNTKSVSVREFIRNYSLMFNDKQLLITLLKDFKLLYFKELPITSDIDPGNLMVQKNPDGYTIRIIDNIGSPVLIPLEYYINYFAKTKANRYWQRFLKWIQKENPQLITNDLIEKLK